MGFVISGAVANVRVEVEGSHPFSMHGAHRNRQLVLIDIAFFNGHPEVLDNVVFDLVAAEIPLNCDAILTDFDSVVHYLISLQNVQSF